MFDLKAWAEYDVEWAAKDPCGFLIIVILALTPFSSKCCDVLEIGQDD